MRMRRAFRPAVSDCLEDRLVPSLATLPAAPAAYVGSVQASLPSNAQATQAFDAFRHRYGSALQGVLLAPSADGTVDPFANRPAFDQAVAQALQTLASDLVASLGTSADASQVAEVTDAILGDDPDSLASELDAVATSALAGQDGASVDTLASDAARATRQAASVVADLVAAPRPSVVASTGAAATATVDFPAVASGASDAATTPILDEVRDAFAAFLQGYYRAARDVLLLPGTGASGEASTRLAAFDERVGRALSALEESVTLSLEGASAPADVIRAAEHAIADNLGGRLSTGLVAIPAPVPMDAASIREFTLGSFRVVVNAFSLLQRDLTQLLVA